MPLLKKEYMPFLLPAVTVIFLMGAFLIGPNITGLTVFAPFDLSSVHITLSTSDTQILPENALITIRLGEQQKSLLAKEFISISGNDYETTILSGAGDEKGFIGRHEYSVNLAKLGFSGSSLGENAHLEVSVTYKGTTLHYEKKTLSFS